MKTLLKRLLAAGGWSLQRLPRGIVMGTELARDLRLVLAECPDACCIDAGANVGSFTSLLLEILPAPRIHAFEPNPATFAELTLRHARTPGVRLHQAGLGEAPGSLELRTVANHALNSFLPLTETGRVRLDALDPARSVSAPVLRLDDYAAAEKLREIDLLKIDTQGFELHVLRGAAGLLAAGRVRAILLELNFARLYEGQPTPAEIITFLDAHDFRLVDFYEKCRHGHLLGWCTALFVRASERASVP